MRGLALAGRIVSGRWQPAHDLSLFVSQFAPTAQPSFAATPTFVIIGHPIAGLKSQI
jgi:hypothetical protein